MKRLYQLMLLAAALLLCAALPMLTASAQEPETRWVEADLSPYLIQAGGFPAERAELCAETDGDMEGARTAILQGLRDLEPEINLRTYGLNADDFWDFYSGVLNDNPSMFYVGGSCSWSYSPSTNTIVILKPQYNTAFYPELEAAIATYETHAQQAMDAIEGLTDPLDKIIVLHDYLAMRASYDYASLELNDTALQFINAHNAYGIMVNGLGVCQSYTLAYADLLQRAGVPVGYAHGPGHIWNMVQVNGQWYNIDLTWNDSYHGDHDDRLCEMRREYFLLSTAELAARDAQGENCHRAEGDEAGRYDHSATDTTYDNYWWRAIPGPIYPDGTGSCVYLSPLPYVQTPYTLRLVRRTGDTETVLCTKSVLWQVWENSASYWVGVFSGLSNYYGKYYFNDATTVWCYDPETGETEQVYSYTGDEGYLYSCMATDGVLWLGICRSANDPMTCQAIEHLLAGGPFTARLQAGRADIAYLHNSPLPTEGTVLCFAAKYNEGRMTAVAEGTCIGADAVQFTRALAPGWKLFFLTDTYKPLTTVELS